MDPLQLPVMPTDPAAASWPPRAPDKLPGALAGGYARTPSAALYSPGGIPTAPPVAAVQTPAPQMQAVAAPMPVIPGASLTRPSSVPGVAQQRDVLHPAQVNYGSGWVADPAAVARGPGYLQALPTMGSANPPDPQANQIRFVDKDSPRVTTSQADPSVVRAGVADRGPLPPGGMSNRQFAQEMPLLVQHALPANRLVGTLMDIAQHRFDMSLKTPKDLADYEAQLQALHNSTLAVMRGAMEQKFDDTGNPVQ